MENSSRKRAGKNPFIELHKDIVEMRKEISTLWQEIVNESRVEEEKHGSSNDTWIGKMNKERNEYISNVHKTEVCLASLL